MESEYFASYLLIKVHLLKYYLKIFVNITSIVELIIVASKPINSEPTAFKTELAGLPNVGTTPATPVVKAVLKTLFSSNRAQGTVLCVLYISQPNTRNRPLCYPIIEPSPDCACLLMLLLYHSKTSLLFYFANLEFYSDFFSGFEPSPVLHFPCLNTPFIWSGILFI